MLMVGVTFNEETHFLELHSSDSIWSFRVKILEQFHIVPDQQYLSVRAGAFSREVGITGDVGSWGIRDGSEIIVVMLDQGKEEMDFIHILDTLRKKCVDITMKSDLGSHMVNQFAVHAHEVRQCDFVEEKMGRNGSPKGNIIHKMLEIGSSLKILNLRWQFFSVGDDGAMLIADALERHKSLIEIHIQACGIASRSAKRMGEMLEKNETLRVVDFNENYSMVDEGVISIAKGIETHSSVIHLTLRGCGISSRGALHMGKMLESNTILKRLVLSENYSIDDVGAIAIANALEKNGSLDELHMCNCGISSKGAIRIGEMLEQSTSLRTLLLNENTRIGDEGAIRIAEALMKNVTLECLGISNCLITEMAAKRFILSFDVNKTLIKFHMDWNWGVKRETLELIYFMIRQRCISTKRKVINLIR